MGYAAKPPVCNPDLPEYDEEKCAAVTAERRAAETAFAKTDKPARHRLTGQIIKRQDPADAIPTCGPDVSVALEATLESVGKQFDTLSLEQREVECSLSHLYGKWDILFEPMPVGCASTSCSDTVSVRGRCYDYWKVNYILFGYISQRCEFGRLKTEGLVAGQKLIRKPLVDGDWEGEYTRDVVGFTRIGYRWTGLLPDDVPGPTGGFSHCEPCEASPRTEALPTTWPSISSELAGTEGAVSPDMTITVTPE